MDEQVRREIDSVIAELCGLISDRMKHINTDKVMALTEAFGKILIARAAISANIPVATDEIALQIADKLEESLNCLNS